MNFLKSFLAALLALVVFSVVGIVMLIVLLSTLRSSDKVVVADNSILRLDLDGEIKELQADNPLEDLPAPFGETPTIGLLQLRASIDHAKDDPKIKGILLNVSSPRAGFSSLEEIRSALNAFRESGKWVFSYGEDYSEGAYFLASVGDKVFLNPSGEMEFDGLTVEMAFFKRLLNKLEINPQVFRVGQFKSAVEPFLMEKMSPENRLQLTELANGIYVHLLEQIAASRSIRVERLKEISDNRLIARAQDAVDMRLIDSLVYVDQLRELLKQRVGIDADADLSFIDYQKYRKSFSTYKTSSNEIAVIVAEGTIVPAGEVSQDVVASDRFVRAVRRVRENDRVKAVVLRVNSPGGEFQATDVLWRELKLTSAQKPVVASMSDYAASGGYYLAVGCDTIVAQPNSITGSIGIFGVLFDMSEFLGDKLGITFDEVRTGNYGDPLSVTRPLTQNERDYWQRKLDENYETFKEHVADGRGTTMDEIELYAKGRVWTGRQALDNHLVDVLGGFDDALVIAAQMARVGDDYRVRYYPEPKTFFEQLLSMSDDIRVRSVKRELGPSYTWFARWKHLSQFHGAQARLPFEFTFH